MAFKRAIIHYIIYFTLFTLMVLVVRSTNTVPEYGLPIVAAFYLTIVYAITCFRLTVSKPEKQFAYPDRLRRRLRLLIYMGWYMLLVLIPGAYLGNKESMFSWHIGLVPAFLYMSMAQSLRPPVKLTPRPGTRDSQWRYMKYTGIYLGISLILIIAAVILCLNINMEYIMPTALVVAAISTLIFFGMIYRLIVTRPHSRFDSMPRKARYKRFWLTVGTYCILGMAIPLAILLLWKWETGTPFQTPITIAFFFTAAYGSDGTPFKGLTIFSGPAAGSGGPGGGNDGGPGNDGGVRPNVAPEEQKALRRKIMEIKRRNEAAGRAKAGSTA